MPRRTSDLLEVFRESEKRSQAASAKKAKAKNARTKKARGGKAKASKKSTGEGVFGLERRQLVYLGSGLCLILALTFLVGLSMGKAPLSKGAGAEAPVRTFIDVVIPKEDPVTRRKIDIRKELRRLVEIYRVERGMLRTATGERSYKIRVGPFADRSAAYEYIADRALTNYQVLSSEPFVSAEMKELRVRTR